MRCAAGEPLDQQVLRPVGVLVLVHHHVPELLAVALAHRLGLLEQLDRLEQQIVEVERVGVLQRLHVDRRTACRSAARADSRRWRLNDLRAFHPVLRVADARQRQPRLQRAVVHAELAQRLLHHRELIGRVVDDEVARQADVRRLAPQQPRAQRVERRDPHLPAVDAEQRLDARPHLLGGLVGEGDGEDAVGLGEPLADEVGDAMRDDARLARARAGEDQQRTFGLENGFLLFGIEAGEEIQASICSRRP